MSTATPRPAFAAQKVDLVRLFDKLPPHAPEAEMALLGSMILDASVVGEVVQIISSGEDFANQRHASLYQVLVELYDKNQSIDLVQLKQRLADLGILEQAGGVSYLVELAESVPHAAGAAYYARIVHEKGMVRRLIDASGRILHRAHTSAEPAEQLLDAAETEIFRLRENRSTTDAAQLGVLLHEFYQQLEAREGQILTGVDTGFTQLNEMTSGLQKGEMIIVAGRPSMGKAQPLDTNVLTPRGWRRMGELRVGDPIASIDGQPSAVTGVFPQGLRQVFRVTFADGRSAECCDEHLWRVHYRGWDGPRVLSTQRLREMLERKRYANRLWIDTFGGDFGCDDDLPLDPWLLGCLIGDGTLSGSSVRFSSASAQTVAQMQEVLGAGITVTAAGGYDYRLTQTGGAQCPGVAGVRPNPIKSALESLGLWGRGAATKFIPAAYKQATRDSRVRLLAGLLDTDGWIEKWGSIRFATASERLARDVVELARSLGGTASYRPKATTYSYLGSRRNGQTAFVCNIQHADAGAFFQLREKRDRLVLRQRQRRLNLVSIEPTRVVPVQCIAVSHPARLYVTDDFVVTHNTAFATNVAEHIAVVMNQPVAFFSLEMSKQQLAQRLLCSASGVDSHRVRRNMLSGDEFARLASTVGRLSESPFFIDDTPGLSLMGLRAKARRLAARHDIKCVVVDYLQLMSAADAESRQQEVSMISRGIKALARELNVPVICLSQLNRSPEGREDHRPRMSDLRESGSIEQDADVVMMLHREEYYHNNPEWKDENPDKVGIAEVILAKQRNGPTGTVTVQFDGNTTRFNNLAPSGMSPY